MLNVSEKAKKILFFSSIIMVSSGLFAQRSEQREKNKNTDIGNPSPTQIQTPPEDTVANFRHKTAHFTSVKNIPDVNNVVSIPYTPEEHIFTELPQDGNYTEEQKMEIMIKNPEIYNNMSYPTLPDTIPLDSISNITGATYLYADDTENSSFILQKVIKDRELVDFYSLPQEIQKIVMRDFEKALLTYFQEAK